MGEVKLGVKVERQSVMANIIGRVFSFCHRPDSEAFDDILFVFPVNLIDQQVH